MDDRKSRFIKFKEIKAMISNMESVLHQEERDEIIFCAEGLLLANSPEEADFCECVAAFEKLMKELDTHRFVERKNTSAKLKENFYACAPASELTTA